SEAAQWSFPHYLTEAVNVGRAVCANNKRNHKNQRVKKPDYKVAYVQLGQGKTFQFPNLFPEKEDSEAEAFDDFRKTFMEKEQQSQKGDPRRGGVPDWFGL
uniref:39S ribosomal protein L23, mitochondrial n=1 Tax=Meleagris gallopavo TaxID=9103 RepID=G1N7F6_MELGA